jgi:hypothetical protein
VIDYKGKKEDCTAKAEAQCRHAHYFAAANVSVVVTTAFLAVVAAISAQSDVATWVTTAAAGVTAGLAIITASFRFQEKSATHQAVAADYLRLAGRYEQLIGWAQPPPDSQPEWLDKLAAIDGSLFKDIPVAESDWVAAKPPAATIV